MIFRFPRIEIIFSSLIVIESDVVIYLVEIKKNDLILKMTPENRRKQFITSQKLDSLAQHPKKMESIATLRCF